MSDPGGEIILYQTEDKLLRISTRLDFKDRQLAVERIEGMIRVAEEVADQ